MDETVSAMLINNPSNPCGSVYSRQHLLDVLKVAEKHHVPIISDDIYQDMVRILLCVCYGVGWVGTMVPFSVKLVYSTFQDGCLRGIGQ